VGPLGDAGKDEKELCNFQEQKRQSAPLTGEEREKEVPISASGF